MKSISSTKFSCGPVECSCYNPAKKFLLKLRKILTHSPKRSRIWLFFKNFSDRRCSPGCKNCSFYKHAEKLLLKLRNFFTQNPEKKWADNFFRKTIHPHFSSGIVKCSFYNSAGRVLSRSTIFWANSEKSVDYTFFWKCVTQKRSSVKLEWSFQFQGKNMLLSGRKIFAQWPKKNKN